MVYVSSELIHTLVGSFGLVLVAPLTAVAGGFVYVPNAKRLIMDDYQEPEDGDVDKSTTANLVWPIQD